MSLLYKYTLLAHLNYYVYGCGLASSMSEIIIKIAFTAVFTCVHSCVTVCVNVLERVPVLLLLVDIVGSLDFR